MYGTWGHGYKTLQCPGRHLNDCYSQAQIDIISNLWSTWGLCAQGQYYNIII